MSNIPYYNCAYKNCPESGPSVSEYIENIKILKIKILI